MTKQIEGKNVLHDVYSIVLTNQMNTYELGPICKRKETKQKIYNWNKIEVSDINVCNQINF